MHHPTCKPIPSVQRIVLSTHVSQWQIDRLSKRKALLMWRTIWWISFVMFWAILVSMVAYTANSQDTNYWSIFWFGLALIAANGVKWFSGGMYCDRLGKLYRKVNQPVSTTETPVAVTPE